MADFTSTIEKEGNDIKSVLESVNILWEDETEQTYSLYHKLFFARYYNQSEISNTHQPCVQCFIFFHLQIQIKSITCNEWKHCRKTNYHTNSRLKQHTPTIPHFLDQESAHSSLGSLLRISQGCNLGVGQTEFSARGSAGARLSSTICAVVGKIHLPAVVKLRSWFSFWLSPPFLGAAQSLATWPSPLPSYSMTAHIFKAREGRVLLIREGPVLLRIFS